MLLNAVLRSEFDPVIQGRGTDYLHRGRIRSSIGNDVAVIARVSGSRDYTVHVRRDGDEVILACTCPYFESGGACKHLWAVLLFAEAEGFLRGDGRPVRKATLADPEDDELEEDFEDDFEDEVDEEPEEEPRHFQPPARNPPLPNPEYTPPARPPAGPSWENALESVTAVPAAVGRTLVWPAGRELLHVVDVAASRSAGVTLGLFTRDPAVRGGFQAPRPLGLARADVARLPDAADRKARSWPARGRQEATRPSRKRGIDSQRASSSERASPRCFSRTFVRKGASSSGRARGATRSPRSRGTTVPPGGSFSCVPGTAAGTWRSVACSGGATTRTISPSPSS